MALFVIGDLHLSLSSDKPMDAFGSDWANYVERIYKGWNAVVDPEDTVIVAGDISWGMSLAESLEDFRFIDKLPGKKLFLKGNHDYFWTTVSGMRRFFAENGLTTMDFIHNSFAFVEGRAVCGTKGWSFEEWRGLSAQDEKIFKRELIRLEASLAAAEKAGHKEKIVVLHYPPFYTNAGLPECEELFAKYGVTQCYYGHLHGKSRQNAFIGERNGVKYRLISADHVQFIPVLIPKDDA